MTAGDYATYLQDIHRVARAAAVAEEEFRKEAARRAEELRTERAFAYRRLHLLRMIGTVVASTGDEEEAAHAGLAVFLREIGYSSEDAGKEIAERFVPVILAVWRADRMESAEASGPPVDVGAALAAFEAWYAETRGSAFLHLMEREIVELPLVEV